MLKRKNILLAFAAISFLSLALSGCSDDIVNPPAQTIDSSDFKYPFTNGSRWNYHKAESAANIRPDSIVQYFSDFPRITNGTVTILYDTVINSVVTKCFLDEYTIAGNVYQNRFYYINNDTALILYFKAAANSAGGFLPFGKIKLSESVSDKGIILNTYESDSYSAIDTIDITLKYPVVRGTDWSTVVHHIGTDYRYLGFENLNNPMGGVISCMKVSSVKSNQLSYPIYLFYSKSGLMKKSQILNDLVVASTTHPEGIGFVDITIETSVTTFQISE